MEHLLLRHINLVITEKMAFIICYICQDSIHNNTKKRQNEKSIMNTATRDQTETTW